MVAATAIDDVVTGLAVARAKVGSAGSLASAYQSRPAAGLLAAAADDLGSAAGALRGVTDRSAQSVIGPGVNIAADSARSVEMLRASVLRGNAPSVNALQGIERGIQRLIGVLPA